MKKKWLTMVMAMTMALGLSGVTVLAQPAATPPQGEERRMTPERREELKKKIELIWQQKLTERLNLTDAEKAKVFPLLQQYHEREWQLRQENRRLVHELEGMIQANAPEKELKKSIKALQENEHKLLEAREQGFDALAKILPAEKQARYIVFQAEFRREIRHLIQQARHREGKPGGPMMRGRPGTTEQGPETP
jgi:Spy/CpxP family protein refolding chaperone